MIDLKKLKEFQSAIQKINDEICEHAQKDLKAKCSDECPYRHLCELLTCAKFMTEIMECNSENSNKTRLS